MKKLLPLSLAAIGITAWLLIGHRANTAEPTIEPRWEYASVRFMGGDKVVVVWPDGKVEPLSALHKDKRPGIADERLYHLTIALNALSKLGFEPATIPSVEPKPDDLFLRRRLGR